jgi:hypothetical protein
VTLGEYLTAAVRKHWEPGRHDCCTFAADWALSWGCGDPMAEWRGRYRSDAGASRFVRQAGGLLELWQRGLASIGIEGVNDAIAGDVGVVRALTAGGAEPVGAICLGRKWAFLAHDGVIFAPAVPLRAWGPRG